MLYKKKYGTNVFVSLFLALRDIKLFRLCLNVGI